VLRQRQPDRVQVVEERAEESLGFGADGAHVAE
jgi:hypothetical protein